MRISIFLTCIVFASVAHAERILYYDPDANFQSIVNITTLVNKYLKKTTNWSFQPVTKREAFETLLNDDSVVAALVSSTYVQESLTKRLDPLLVPEANGDVFYHKIILDRGQGTAGDLDGKESPPP